MTRRSLWFAHDRIFKEMNPVDPRSALWRFCHPLRSPASRTRRLLRWTRRLLLTLLLPVLLLAGFAQWWLLPRLNDYRDELAGALSNALHMPVSIAVISAALDGGRLALRLRDVSLHEAGRDATLARFDRALVTLNLWRSLREWRPVIGHIRLEGASLTLESGVDGIPRLRAEADQPSMAIPPTAPQPVRDWLFDLRGLDIVGERLALRLPDGSAVQLLHPYLQLRETAQGRRLELTADLPPALGERLEITFEPSTASGGWRLDGRIYQPQTPLEFSVAPTASGWQATLRHGRAEHLLAWAMPWLDAPARQWLTPLNPQGALPEIVIQAESGQYAVRAALHELRTHPLHGLPGLRNLTGQIDFTPTQGRIELDSRAVQVDTAGLLRAPITLDTLRGTVAWRREADHLRLDSAGLELANSDLYGRFWGQVRIPDAGEPWLEIHSRYRDVKVSQARRYLPVAVIPPEGVAWLDQALVSGRVTSGEMIFRGPPAAFPFDRNQGLFETRFQVENAVLDYQPGWPRLERLKTEVWFRNRGLQVEASAGRLLDGVLEQASARIDDLSEVVVQVQGRAKGPAASLWRALKDSPLGRELDDDLPDLQASGVSTLDLELSVPTDVRPTQARGRISLLDNGVTLPAWNMALERLRGEVEFSESSLDARNVQARWRGQPIRLDLELAGREGRRELRTQVRGRLGLTALAGTSASALQSRVTGRSDWKAVLTVPTGQERRSRPPVFKLDLQSDLRGIALDLPEPFAKPAEQAEALRIVIQPLAADRWSVDLAYGAATRALLAVQNGQDAPRLERGELRINTGAATLPDQPGLSVVADLPRWRWPPPTVASASDPDQPRSNADDSGFGFLSELRQLQARIGQLTLAGSTFDAVTVNAARYPGGLRVELDSATLAGRLTAPDQPSPDQPFNAALQRAYLSAPTPSASSSSSPLADPRQWPPLVFTVADLRVNNRIWGRLRLVAMPDAQGLRLSRIELSSPRQRITASGAWGWNGSRQTAQLKAMLHSPALGATLADFGYPDAGIAGGATQAELDAEWSGAPTDFALERLAGALQFRVGSGQFLEINPGLGRLIGLFSVQNLSRRLNLDFSDLFQPGAGFDRISGNVRFERGQARLQHLRIEAPAAQVDIQGRVGLQNRDYDQQITVTPRLGGALPIAGALAGGPVTGAAVFVAERLLQKGIEQATRYHYRLRGSWDAPLLEPLTAPPPPSAAQPGFTNETIEAR